MSLFDSHMSPAHASIVVGWVAMLGGVISGSTIGLFFHRAEWLGGYSSFRRRMVRLAHISFFGIGFVNVLFGITVATIPFHEGSARTGSVALIVAAVAMPANCLLTAWREGFRRLFFVPVLAVAVGVISVLVGGK